VAVTLVFLGRLADLAGASERSIEPAPLEAVLTSLDPLFSAATVKLALNGTLLASREGVAIADGDELAFLPPVSGG
jgi:molybdopterin synthase sulfur carrier subunit